jgi:hypothetical protein
MSMNQNESMKILSLFFILFSNILLASPQDSLTLYFLPSPEGMDWSGPKNLAWSVIKNRFANQDRFLGHVYVQLSCSGKEELTGMRAKNFDYLRQLLWENRGFGILYHSFEGKLEETSELAPELNKLLQQGKLNFSRFLLNQGQCNRLMTYLREFKHYKVDRYYGLANRPLYGEGAGCSAFGASFLEVAGILDQEFKDNWQNFLNIPLDFAGPPVTDQTVSFLKILFMNADWTPENKPHKKIIFWDPDRMYGWVQQKIKGPRPQNLSLLKIENSQGVVFDKSNWPVPARPIWKQHTDPTYSKK